MQRLLTLLAFALVAFTANAQSTLKGDVNGDGGISITDVTTLVDVILIGLPQNTDTSIYDINGDGDVTVSDVTGLVDMILNGNGNGNGNGGNGGGTGDTSQAYLTCPDDNHPHMIDLGLPSGTLWSCCNVGATKPEDYGGYYAWGEVEEKAVYNEVTYQYCTGEDTDGDGWYERNMQWQSLGSDIAGTGYDVAHVRWGGSWVMPSLDQIIELLLNKCSTKWTTKNGVNGRTFTGPSGGTIFLPAAGYRWYVDLDSLRDAGSDGYYWSSAQDPSYSSDACNLYFRSGYAGWSLSGSRSNGRTVRPVSR